MNHVTIRVEGQSEIMDIYKRDDDLLEIVLDDGSYSISGLLSLDVLKKHLALLEG